MNCHDGKPENKDKLSRFIALACLACIILTMGNAHCTVANQSSRQICVITFNMADLTYKTYNSLYIIEPGGTQNVEANPDAIGLKVGIIYRAETANQEFHFHRFTCHNDSTLTVTSIEGDDIDYYGDGTSLQGKGKLKESQIEPFNMVAEASKIDLAVEKQNRVQQEARKILTKVKDSAEVAITKVKDTTEGVLTKVTGKEVTFGGSTHHHESTGSLSSASVEVRPPAPSSPTSSMYNKPTTPSSKQATGTQKRQSESKEGIDEFSGRTATTTAAVEEDPQAAYEKWEAELQRAKKQKAWEAEVERIRKDRQQRDEVAALEQIASKRPQQTAPVVGKGGCGGGGGCTVM